MKNCNNCYYFKKLFRHFCVFFCDNEECYCLKSDKLTDKDGICENWLPKINEADFSKRRFDETFEDLQFIADYINKKALR